VLRVLGEPPRRLQRNPASHQEPLQVVVERDHSVPSARLKNRVNRLDLAEFDREPRRLRDVQDFQSQDGYVVRELNRVYKWTQLPGSSFIFSDGTTSSATTEKFKEIGTTEVVSTQINEDTVLRTTKFTNRYAAGDNFTNVVKELGSLSPIEIKDGYVLRSNYDNDGDFAAALWANRYDQREVTAGYRHEGLEKFMPRRDIPEVYLEYAESLKDLQDWNDRTITFGRGFSFSFAVPVHALLREGDFIHVQFPGAIAIDNDAFVVGLNHTGGEGQPMLTQVRTICLPAI